jgi:hypothetical protein
MEQQRTAVAEILRHHAAGDAVEARASTAHAATTTTATAATVAAMRAELAAVRARRASVRLERVASASRRRAASSSSTTAAAQDLVPSHRPCPFREPVDLIVVARHFQNPNNNKWEAVSWSGTPPWRQIPTKLPSPACALPTAGRHSACSC